MSVQIAPAYDFTADVAGYGIVCCCGGLTSPVLGKDYETVEGMLATHTPVCGSATCAETCAEYGGGSVVAIHTFGELPLVDLSSTNARFVFEALGYVYAEGEDMTGEEDAAAFLGRVLTALALAPTDEGMLGHEDPRPGATLIHCGRRVGYLQGHLTELHALAQWAMEHGREVQWA